MRNNKSSVSTLYIISVSLGSFLLAVIFFWLSNLISVKLHSIVLSVVFLLLIILTGIIADIVGVSVTAASEVPLHAKAAKKVPGALEGVYLVRNADRVANLMNDVVGDIAGTVSGALGIALAIQILAFWKETGGLILNLLLTATIAAVTVGGKAAGKRLAMTRSNDVVFMAGRILNVISGITGIDFGGRARKSSR
ncbi:MAG: hypothetical protein ACOY31_06235 [Bacillota bacterium]